MKRETKVVCTPNRLPVQSYTRKEGLAYGSMWMDLETIFKMLKEISYSQKDTSQPPEAYRIVKFLEKEAK